MSLPCNKGALPLARIIMAAKWASELREKILSQGGIYTGMETPNIQSIIDILTISDATLKKQKIAKKHSASDKEIAWLELKWSGKAT